MFSISFILFHSSTIALSCFSSCCLVATSISPVTVNSNLLISSVDEASRPAAVLDCVGLLSRCYSPTVCLSLLGQTSGSRLKVDDPYFKHVK